MPLSREGYPAYFPPVIISLLDDIINNIDAFIDDAGMMMLTVLLYVCVAVCACVCRASAQERRQERMEEEEEERQRQRQQREQHDMQR